MGLGFHLASKTMEWREKRRNGSARSFLQGASDEKTWPATGAALPGWQTARNGDGTCLREKERSTGVGVGWERRKELGQGPEKE